MGRSWSRDRNALTFLLLDEGDALLWNKYEPSGQEVVAAASQYKL